DSLRLFSPRRFSSFPGYPFPGDPDGYPGRDEVVEYLRGYADRLGVEVRTNARVVDVTADGPAFTVEVPDGSSLVGDALIAASGSFGNPHVPAIPGRGHSRGGFCMWPTTGRRRSSPGSGSWSSGRATPPCRWPTSSPSTRRRRWRCGTGCGSRRR